MMRLLPYLARHPQQQQQHHWYWLLMTYIVITTSRHRPLPLVLAAAGGVLMGGCRHAPPSRGRGLLLGTLFSSSPRSSAWRMSLSVCTCSIHVHRSSTFPSGVGLCGRRYGGCVYLHPLLRLLLLLLRWSGRPWLLDTAAGCLLARYENWERRETKWRRGAAGSSSSDSVGRGCLFLFRNERLDEIVHSRRLLVNR